MYPYKCDLSNTKNVQDMFEWIENHPELGKVDICVCNAGKPMAKSLSDIRYI